MNQLITVLKQIQYNSEYVTVYKAFIQKPHLSILKYHWNTKSYGGDI